MRFRLGLFNKRRINLIIQDHVIRYLDLRQPELLEVKSSGERYLPEGIIQDGVIMDRETLLLLLEECVNDWGIKGREVQFLIPDSKLVIRKQQIPVDHMDDEIKGYLYMELGRTIHLPFEDPVFDYVLLEKDIERREILLFAASEQMVTEYSALMEDAKLKPVAADASCVALYRLIYVNRLVSEEDHVLCLQFDIPSLQLSIFHHHKPQFFNYLKINTDMKNWNINMHSSGVQRVKWHGDSEFIHGIIEDKLVEIERIINYYKFSMNNGQQGITKVVVTGEFPELSHIQDRLQSMLNIPVNVLDQSDYALPSQFGVVLGLGLKEAGL
ncbi:pilus assembly protein PilM [Fictibacillus nanhaiensis]|uniref:type IV pilus biogenesis protein PilM n=1 Tax=Fictibacillus nanhaiensis TaxID=742169 RepID=UPI001C97FB61|nr:pilus assembly protein PilM [Fictibacillus nanhaiensis]MBY6037043.1 pilus assembly protein PilM [Fictibacillus nanhaiensis]